MAKKFLVNIDMGGLSLLNFRAHPASSAPTATGSGQLYYDTSTSKLYFSTGTGTGNWTQLVTGTTAVSSLNGNTGSVTINGTSNQIAVTGNATNPIVISLPSSIVFPGKVTFAASTTSASSANIPAGTGPTTAADGDIWRASGNLKFYDGTNTRTLAYNETLYVGTTAVQTTSANQTLTGITLTTPVIDQINASSTSATTSILPTVTTGSIAIGAGLTTGALNIATVGTGVTPITIGHANSTLTLGNLTTAGFLKTNSSGVVSVDTTTYLTSSTGVSSVQGTANQITPTTATTGAVTLAFPTGGVTLPGKTTLTASTSGAASLNLPVGVSVTSPAQGDIYNVSDTLYYKPTGTARAFAFTDSNITGSAATLTTPRSIYGNNFDGSANLTQIIASTYGGTGNGFTKFTGPTSTEKTFTLPDASATILTTNAVVTLTQGGTNASLTASNGGIVYSTGSAMAILSGTATAGKHLQSGSSGAPSWTTATFPSSAGTTGTILRSDGTNWVNSASVYPDTVTANRVIIASATNTISDLATVSNQVLASTGGTIGWVSTLPSGVTGSSLTSVGTLSGLTATGTVNFGSATTVTVPTPVNGTDAANKTYVDNVASGMNAHDAVKYATTAALGTTGNLVGGTITTTYANGSSGVGATLTIASSSTWTSITIDGQSLTVGDRVLIKNQASALQNGIYTVTQVGTLANSTSFIFTRATDNDSAPELGAGDFTYVLNGTNNGGNGFIQTAVITTVGTDSVTWTQFSGASSVLAGLGLVVNGTNPNQIDVGTASSLRIVVNTNSIDLATVSQSNTTTGPASNFVSTVSVDPYGRVTGVNTTTHVLATAGANVGATTLGIASFNNAMFGVSSGFVSLANTAVTAASYGTASDIQYPTFTVDAQGRLTAAATTTIRNAAADGSTKGVAAFSSTGFSASSGVISLASGSTSAGANDVGSSYTYATQRASATLTGTGSKSSWTISHNLGTRDITVQVYQTSATPDTQYAEVEVDIVRTATGTITITFATAPALNDTYNVVMVG